MWEIASLLWGAGYLDHGAIQEAGHPIEGLGFVLIGWGVVQEERNGMSRLLGGGTRSESVHAAGIDAVCHYAGLSLLVLGLIAEILVQCGGSQLHHKDGWARTRRPHGRRCVPHVGACRVDPALSTPRDASELQTGREFRCGDIRGAITRPLT
ncbi:hypothetical protein MKK63_21425 [Methylobacterium sp. J-088]|uniref:hypothetical protein n=1 Tax=Methylobacterium sp. J-088 TaxID=2836664 RepID=UPI001FB967E5|nr:hypothetical protein [Methylobacterium sp. J-088]MCJ2065255.1 hypothetical protein [Methylobacterium sp. J-088]